MDKIILNSDALGIVDRIKQINSNYRVYYNIKTKKYMLYLFENTFKPEVYCLTYPFDSIDERMIEHTLKSEIQNRKAVLKEIEDQNARLLLTEQKRILQEMENLSESKRNN